MIKKNPVAFICAAIAVILTVYIPLDTFVIGRVYESDITASESLSFPKSSDDDRSYDAYGSISYQSLDISHLENTETYESYTDENMTIQVISCRYMDTQVYIADIMLSSAEYIKTAFAHDTYGRNITEKTSEQAERNNAVLAVNGDYYGVQEKGICVHNGVVYRSTAKADTDICCIFSDGTMEIVKSEDFDIDALTDRGLWQAFSFGPELVSGSSVAVSENDEVGKAMASNPRTAIGCLGNNHFVFVVSDGRTDESNGLSLYELAEFMQSIGVEMAYNLDGGGSSTMYYMGEVINNPTTSGRIKERSVSDIVYIG